MPFLNPQKNAKKKQCVVLFFVCCLFVLHIPKEFANGKLALANLVNWGRQRAIERIASNEIVHYEAWGEKEQEGDFQDRLKILSMVTTPLWAISLGWLTFGRHGGLLTSMCGCQKNTYSGRRFPEW